MWRVGVDGVQSHWMIDLQAVAGFTVESPWSNVEFLIYLSIPTNYSPVFFKQ